MNNKICKDRNKLEKHIIIFLFCTSIGCLPCVSSDKGEEERISLYKRYDHSGNCSKTPINKISSFSMWELSNNEEIGWHGKSDSESQEDITPPEVSASSIEENIRYRKSSSSYIQVESTGLYQAETVASVGSLIHNSSQYLSSIEFKKSEGIIESSTSSSESSPRICLTTSTRRVKIKENIMPTSKIRQINASSNLIPEKEKSYLLSRVSREPAQVTLYLPELTDSVILLNSNLNLIKDKKKKQKNLKTNKQSKTSEK